MSDKPNKTEKDITKKDPKKDLENAQKEIDSLNEKLNVAQEEITTLTENVAAADLKIKALSNDLATQKNANTELEELKKELIDEIKSLREERDELLNTSIELKDKLDESVAALQKAKVTGVVALLVKGSYTAKWKNPLGEEQSRKIEFLDGATKVRLNDDLSSIVSTESVLKLANNKQLTKAELEASPALGKWKTEDAVKYLTHLAQIRYGLLK